MRKSFTRLLSLVMFLTLFSSITMAAAPDNVRPIDGTTKAWTKTTDKIMVIYPEAVKANSGSIRVTKFAGGALVAVLPATDSRISYTKGDTVVVDLSASLSELTEYVVSIDATTFKTVKDGYAKGGEIWNFTTGDYTAPTLKSVEPVKDASLSTSSISLKMTFEDASTILLGSGKVTLYKADGNVWDLISVTSGTLTGTGPYLLTLPTVRTLEDNVNYAVTIDAGAITDDGKRADAKKNAYAGLTDRTAWKFSSKDFTAPGYATDYPKKGTITNTSAAVLVKTTEAGKALAVISTSATVPSATDILNDGAKKTVTVVADTEYSINFTGLAEATQYYIYVATQNNDGVLSSSVTSVDPITSETANPLLSAVIYKKGGDTKATGTVASNMVTTATSVAQDVDNIILDFNEEVKIGAGNIIIYKAVDNSVFATIASSSLSVNNDDKSLVKVPVSGMQNNTKYYVTIPNTIVLDKYANKYSGISAITAWTFTSNDVVGPTFTYTPAEGSSNVKIDANIVLTFNELIFPKAPFTTADAFVVKVNGTSVAYATGVSTNDNKFTTYTIDPADFPSSAVVTVEIKPNSLTDIGGNVVDPQGQGINFVVVDKAAPVLSSWSAVTKPSDNIVIKFNEAIYFAGGGDITNANLYTILTVKETDSNGSNVAYTATINDNKKEISIVPTTPWVSEKSYYVSISSALQDAAGNAYVGVSPSNTYNIADVTSASVDLSSVDGKTISTSAPVTLAFKEGNAVEPRVSLNYNSTWNAYSAAGMEKVIVLKEGSANGPDVAFTVTSGDDATFAIIAALQGNKTYYLGVGASTKGADGNVNGAKFVTFNTLFEGTPTVASLSPSDNDVQVDKAANFVITFDTDVAKAGGVIAPGTLYYTDGGASVNVADGEVSINGKVVTINLASELSNDKNYDIVVSAGVFKNKNSAAANTAINVDAWDFATKDTKLDVQTLAPDFATNVAIDAKLVITFNEKVVKGLGFIDIKKTGTDVTVERIDVVSSQVAFSNSDKTVTITPSATLSYNTEYYVEVSAGALKDGVGNSLNPIFGKADAAANVSIWTFKTANPGLAIVKVTPADGSDKIASDASIVVEFNREIAAVSGEVGYIEWKDGVAQTQSYPFGSTNISISGKKLTILHPNKVFPAGSEIFVYLPAGVLKAATDGAILNTLVDRSTNDVSFFTGDVNAPKPSFTPEQFVSWNAVYTPVDANITITFDEDILNLDGTSIDNGDVTSGGMFSISGVGSFVGSISGKTVTLDPTSNLSEFTDYTITVLANKIKDANGKVITSNITSTFKTVDKSAPTVAFTLSGGDKKVLLSNVSVTDANANKFYYLLRVKSSDAAPTADEIKAANNKDASSGTVTGFNLGSLVPSTAYQLYYLSDDKFGNTSSVSVKEASTDDTVAPTLASTNPANDAADVNTSDGNIEVKVTFNEKIQIGAGAITVRDFATQAILFSLDQTALATVSGDDKSLKLTIPGVSATGSPVKMYVEIAAGTIKDMANNSYGGALGMNTISFTTEDNQKPTVNSGSSTNGNVDLDTNIKVVFSENVKAGNGNLVLYKSSVDVNNAVQVFTAAEATFSGNTATVNPSADLANGQVYFVSVEAGFAKDMSSNGNGNVANAAVTFTGSSNIRPSVTSVNPGGGTTAIVKSLLANIEVQFSEGIYLTVAGYAKPLALMSQAELLARFSLKDENGNSIVIDQVVKNTASKVTVVSAANRFNDQASYTLTISGFEDNTGLVMDNKVVSYVTSDGTAPVITFSPAYKNTSVNPATILTMTFSETIYDEVINRDSKIFSYVDNLNVKNFVFLKEGSVTGSDVAFAATIDGKVITLVPNASLKSGVKYYYGMSRTVEDINMTEIPVPTEEKTFVYFTAADYSIPELEAYPTNFSPLGSGVSASAAMSVTFKEEIVVSTGSVIIRREDGTIFQTVSGADLSIDSNNNKKLKIAHNNFEPFTNYFVEIGASVVVDKTGNPNTMFNDPTPAKGWLFTTNDTYALTATVTPNGDNTPRSVNLEMTFNKAPIAQAGKFVAVYKADGTAVYQVAASSLMINGKTATFPNVALAANQAYYARVEPGAFKDASANTYAGIMDNSWVFSTVDNIAPKLVAVAPLSPINNAVGVSQAATFKMTFDRPVLVGTGNITVRDKVSGAIVSQVSIADATIEGSVVTFRFPNALAKNQSYYVLVPAGAVTNTEITKDNFGGIINTYDWAFTTGSDEVAPTFVSGTPSGATNLQPAEVRLVGTFSERVVAKTGNVVIYAAANDSIVEKIAILPSMIVGEKLTVAPTTLKVSTTYYVLIDAGSVKDLIDNDFAGLTDKATWTFTTGDFTGPTVIVTAPVAPIATIFTVGLKFSEPVSGVLAGITATGGKIEEITGTGADYVITVSAKEQTEVTIVLSDMIKDLSVNTNKFAGKTLVYKTGDFTAPKLVSWTPLDVNLADNYPTFKMTFNEDVVLGEGGMLKVYKVGTSTARLSIPITAAMVSGKVVTVSYTYDPAVGGLDGNTRYYVLVEGSALTDVAKNKFVGVSDVAAWTFKTGPWITKVDPNSNISEFKVYPNPFVDVVNLMSPSGLSKVVVTNIAGQVVKEVVNPANSIQLNELRSGIYFISLYDMDNVIAKTAKIVKR